MIYFGNHAIPSVSRILNNVSQKHRERRRLNAETELLEAQTALLRRQLQQIEDAEVTGETNDWSTEIELKRGKVVQQKLSPLENGAVSAVVIFMSMLNNSLKKCDLAK